jgi:anti-anti-sigma regulatory factor
MTTPLARLAGEGYAVDVRTQGRSLELALTGTFDMTAAPALSEYLEKVQAETKRAMPAEVVFDVTGLYYLGSSCIKAFVSLTVAFKALPSGPKLRVITNPRLDWQERTFLVLARLAPSLVTVE